MAVSFNIHPLTRFEQSGQTTIKRPREFACFSFDENHQLKVGSDESIRYYYPPFFHAPGASTPAVNLSRGFDRWVRHDDSSDSHLDALLQTLQAHEEALLRDGVAIEDIKTQADVITWRGMMTKILTAGFDIFSDFEMNATSYQGAIYIEENHMYKQMQEENSASQSNRHHGGPPQELMQYWGYKFETLSVLKQPWAESTREEIENRTNELVNNKLQYCSIVRTGIGNTSLVLAGEVDCILGGKPETPGEPIRWVELKTTAPPKNHNHREEQKYERKLLKYWAQSFLLGVPKIVVGFRTLDGELTHTQELDTQGIPNMVSRGQRSWDGNVCINMTAGFLDFLKATIIGTEGVWRIKRTKDSNINVHKVQETGTGDIITPEFKAHRERLLAAQIAQRLGGSGFHSGNGDTKMKD